MAVRGFGRRAPTRAQQMPDADVAEEVQAPGQEEEVSATQPVAAVAKHVVTSAIADLAAKVHAEVVDGIDSDRAVELEFDELTKQIYRFFEEKNLDALRNISVSDRRKVARRLAEDIKGLGPLEPLLTDPSISDILVNGHRSVYVEQKGLLHQIEIKFRDEDHLLFIAQRIAEKVGRRVDESSPMVDARLEDGSRVNIVIPPLAIDGTTISIRRFVANKIGLEELAAKGAMSQNMASMLEMCIRGRLNVVVSGGTGAGKTTMLNALSTRIDSGERLITIEDAAELQLQQPHVVRLESRKANAEGSGEVSLRELLINALRMRPNRIIVGEVRGAEIVEMLTAMNTGHPGSMCTIHANNPRDALMRIESLMMMVGMEMPLTAIRRQVSEAVDLIVQVARLRTGHRCVTSISEVVGMEGETITTEEMWKRPPEEEENVFYCTGRLPSWAKKLSTRASQELSELLQQSKNMDDVS